ncbi:MAG: hypothetical protein AAGH88_08535 [Planctomycetota bacterium]
MSIGQDRLTFYGVLVAIVIAVIGYIQIAKLYPVAGRTEAQASQTASQTQQEDAEAGVTRPEEVVE